MGREITLTVDGHTLAALDLNPESSAPPIILLHGIAVSIHSWLTVKDLLIPFGHCYSLSLPGHYPAKFPENFSKNQITSEMMASVLNQAIQQLVGDRPVTLIGISTGGFAALAIASQYPHRVPRLACISGFAKGKWTGLLGYHQWLARHGWLGRMFFKFAYISVRPRILFPLLWELACGKFGSFGRYAHKEAFYDSTLPNFRKLDLDSLADYYEVLPKIDISGQLSNVKCPTLVMAGDKDPFIPIDQARLIAEKTSQSKLMVMKGAGHLIFAEQPEEFEGALKNWLKETARND